MARTKYILIDRGPEYHPTAVSAAVLADMKQRGDTILSERPVTQAEIKKERIHVYEDDHYFGHRAFGDFEKRVTGKRLRAEVIWFERSSGEGMVRVEGEGHWPLYACNIKGAKTWYETTACVYLNAGDWVEVEIKPFPGNSLVVCHTAGHFDSEKWNSLDQSELAFRCNEDGKLVTGLFA